MKLTFIIALLLVSLIEANAEELVVSKTKGSGLNGTAVRALLVAGAQR